MGNEQLSKWQASQLEWLKRQVDNLADESKRDDARPRINQELFAAREELDNYVEKVKTIRCSDRTREKIMAILNEEKRIRLEDLYKKV